MAAAPGFSSELRLRLRDESVVVVRPIRADDKQAIEAAFARLSEQSRYQRFMTSISELSGSQLRYLTEVDHHDHEALVAFDAEGEEGVAVARFVRLADGHNAEAAVTVVDDWQGKGLGTALCNLLAERAREEGSTGSPRCCWPATTRCTTCSPRWARQRCSPASPARSRSRWRSPRRESAITWLGC